MIEEHTLFAAITGQVVKIPFPDGQSPVGREQGERIIQFMLDRSKKVNAAEANKPHGKLPTSAEGIAQFSKAREESIAWVRATQLDLRAFGAPNAMFRYLRCVSILHLDGRPLSPSHRTNRRSSDVGQDCILGPIFNRPGRSWVSAA